MSNDFGGIEFIRYRDCYRGRGCPTIAIADGIRKLICARIIVLGLVFDRLTITTHLKRALERTRDFPQSITMSESPSASS